MRALAFTLLLATTSCGYRFGAPNSRLLAGVTSLRVPLAQNRTGEPGVEVLVTQALREAYARAGRLDEHSDASLDVVVVGVASAPFITGLARPTYKLTVALQATLTRGGAPVTQITTSKQEEFPTGGDTLLTESNRGAALRRVAELLARDVAERLSN
jgi:Lipopolysaccharide-assembly